MVPPGGRIAAQFAAAVYCSKNPAKRSQDITDPDEAYILNALVCWASGRGWQYTDRVVYWRVGFTVLPLDATAWYGNTADGYRNLSSLKVPKGGPRAEVNTTSGTLDLGQFSGDMSHLSCQCIVEDTASTIASCLPRA